MKSEIIYKVLFSVFLGSIASNGFAQKTMKAKLISENGNPVHYAAVGIIGTEIGTVSNLQGDFEINTESYELKETDTLRISMLGFKPINLNAITAFNRFNEEQFGVIKMEVLPIELNEIQVKSNFVKTVALNKFNKSGLNMLVSFALSESINGNLGSEIGKKFNITHSNSKLSKFGFSIAQNNFDTVIFRINVYSEKHNLPNQNLLNVPIIVQLENRKTGRVEVDFLPYKITVSADIIVSVEWIGKSAKGNVLTMPISMPTPYIHYYKYGSQNHWKKFRSMTTPMTLELKI